MGLEFIVIAPLLLSCCGFYFVFGREISFFGGCPHPLVDSCSTASCSFGAGGDGQTFFYPVILNEIQFGEVRRQEN